MILEIEYDNVKVFKDTVTLSMEATESAYSDENVAEVETTIGKIRVLKSAAIYGSNAAGKTTVISMLYMLRRWWRNEWSTDELYGLYFPFMLNDHSVYSPSKFRIRYIQDKNIYNYRVAFTKNACIEESLTVETAEDEKLIVYRDKTDNAIHNVVYGNAIPQSRRVELSGVASTKSLVGIFSSVLVSSVSEALSYLAGIEISNGYNEAMRNIMLQELRPWFKNSENKSRLLKFENLFDINLSNIRIPQKEDSTSNDIIYEHRTFDETGTETKGIRFSSDLESQGTRILTLIGAKVIQALDTGKPLFIDEMDSCFHTELSKMIVRMFNDPVINKKNAQLIITSHNVDLMDNNLFRRDQIWFIEKNSMGVSSLYSLCEFSDVMESTDFRSWYLGRKLGAIPKTNIFEIRKLF